MIDIDSVMELKKKVEKLKQEKERAKGRVEQLLKTLEEKFGCSNLTDARALLKRKKRALSKLENEFNERESAFREKWRDKLNIGETR